VKRTLHGMIGVVMGLVYYALYVAALPAMFQGIAGLPFELRPPVDPSTALALFMVLGMAESIVPATVGAAFGVLSKAVGSLYLYCVTNGEVISATVAGYSVTIDLSILIYAIVAGSIIVGVADASMRACEEASKV